MPDEDLDETATRYDWERVIRRARLGSPAKAVALAMATYADRDGSRVYPGVARLAAVTELSERSVRAALKKLRELGLIRRVYQGGHRGVHSFTDVHQLTIPVDLIDRVDLLPVGEEVPSQPAPRAAWQASQPAPRAAQPAGGAAQPAPDDIPTGTTCTPPRSTSTSHQPTQLQNDQSPFETELLNARANSGAEIISLNGWGGRR